MNDVNYKKILVTYDGSKLSLSALPHAVSLARMYNAELFLLHIIDQNDSMIMGADASVYVAALQAVKRTIKLEKQQTQKQFAKIKANLEKNGLTNIKTSIQEGVAEDIIINFAKSENCDLIVMSTHGRSGIARTFLGSVTDYVLRHALCPVFVIHPIIPKKNSNKRRTHETKK